MQADAASCDRSRAAHRGLADGYGIAIERQRALRHPAPASIDAAAAPAAAQALPLP